MARKKKNFTCAICLKKFAGSTVLQSHMNVHLDKKPFKCEICGRDYPSVKSLKEHQKIHQSEQHICQKCGKVFFYGYKLRLHEKTCQLVFECECGKKYQRKKLFEKHKVKHLPAGSQTDKINKKEKREYKFKCEFCKKGFETVKLRDFHMKNSHTKK